MVFVSGPGFAVPPWSRGSGPWCSLSLASALPCSPFVASGVLGLSSAFLSLGSCWLRWLVPAFGLRFWPGLGFSLSLLPWLFSRWRVLPLGLVRCWLRWWLASPGSAPVGLSCLSACWLLALLAAAGRFGVPCPSPSGFLVFFPACLVLLGRRACSRLFLAPPWRLLPSSGVFQEILFISSVC